jgi:RNA polymerase sigma factor (sigma-70 family)
VEAGSHVTQNGAVAALDERTDSELVAAVRIGDDSAFEQLYRRYHRRIAGYVRRLVRDEARTEDVTQDVFFSALRRLRATEAKIVFKPWVHEIARNAAIDLHRRSSRADEVSIDSDDLLRPSDRQRLVGRSLPYSELVQKERMEHLCGALDELSDTHHRVIVMRELEGLSYREIGERLHLTRAAVESALFRARRRLEQEYEALDTGRRCESMRSVIARVADGTQSPADLGRLGRHARRCSACRRRARELGVEPLRRPSAAARAAALLALPGLLRRRLPAEVASPGGAMAGGGQVSGSLGALFGSGAQLGAAVAERAAALVAAAALAGAGGMALSHAGPFADHRGGQGSGGSAGPKRSAAPDRSPAGSAAEPGDPGRPPAPGAVGEPPTPSGGGRAGKAADAAEPGAPLGLGGGSVPSGGGQLPGVPGMPDFPSLGGPPPPPPADQPQTPSFEPPSVEEGISLPSGETELSDPTGLASAPAGLPNLGDAGSGLPPPG